MDEEDREIIEYYMNAYDRLPAPVRAALRDVQMNVDANTLRSRGKTTDGMLALIAAGNFTVRGIEVQGFQARRS